MKNCPEIGIGHVGGYVPCFCSGEQKSLTADFMDSTIILGRWTPSYYKDIISIIVKLPLRLPWDPFSSWPYQTYKILTLSLKIYYKLNIFSQILQIQRTEKIFYYNLESVIWVKVDHNSF